MNFIIINADDYGLNERNSHAIAEAFSKQLITDTTMLANFSYFDEAVKLAQKEGFIDRIGIHLNLTEGKPLTRDIEKCERFVSDGVFNKRYNNDRVSPLSKAEKDAIYKELSAQADRIKNAGIRMTHADSHHHIHTSVTIAPIAVRVCREHGIDKIRLHRNLGQISGFKKFVKKRYNIWLRKQGFVTTGYFAYVMDIENAPIPDSTEIMVHPDFDQNGVLIDRRGIGDDGFPFGNPLPDLVKDRNTALKGYSDL